MSRDSQHSLATSRPIQTTGLLEPPALRLQRSAPADSPLPRSDHSGKPTKLGDILVRSGAISREQLDYALGEQRKRRIPLGRLLVKLEYVTDDTVRQALGRQLNISYIDLDRVTIDRSLTRLINSSYAKRYAVIPVALVAQTLTICMDDPTNTAIVEDLTQSTGLNLTVVTASQDAIARASIRLYEPKAPLSSRTDAVDLVLEEDAHDTGKSRYVDEYRQHKQADVIVRQLMSLAIAKRASDIHLEMMELGLQVRFRIDGLLEHLSLGPLQQTCNQAAREIVSRIKVLAKLDIAERRRPQDGGFRVGIKGTDEKSSVDLRVSVVPSYYGESVVIRILDRKQAPQSIEQLQFPPAVAEKLRQLLQRPSGMLLVTGPTGSGKSTTLYASLMTLHSPQIRILTAEDPIEYVYEQFSQSEVNTEIGNTFASYLRAFLRHDPEVIMVGEIRDEATAEMAFRAAQTGHLLLSTLHTESAISSLPRLLSLGIDRNTLASALVGVLGQRLVRQVCSSCETEYEPAPDLLREFFARRPAAVTFKKGRGCSDCNYSGYRGRFTIVELWAPDNEDIMLLNKNADFEEIQDSARRSTLAMADSMLASLEQGRTTLEELMRVMPYSMIRDFRQRQSAHGRLTPVSKLETPSQA